MTERENDEDWHISTATHGPDGTPLTPLFHCAKCNRCLPPADFKRYMTRAEAKAHGYSGERLVQIETEHCKKCRPRRRRRIEAFTTPELKAKARRGEISEVLVASVEKERQRRARSEIKAGITKRWDMAAQKTWLPLLDALKDEVRAVTQQRKHANTRGSQATRQSVLAYCDGYLALLRHIRADLTLTMRRTKLKAGPNERWQQHATHEEKAHIAALWAAIEPNHAHKMRPPQLFDGPVPLVVEKVGKAEGTPPDSPATVITSPDWDSF